MKSQSYEVGAKARKGALIGTKGKEEEKKKTKKQSREKGVKGKRKGKERRANVGCG